jgi:hypothetical protein
MDNDQRDRRDWPEPDGTVEGPIQDEIDATEASRPAGEPADPYLSPDAPAPEAEPAFPEPAPAEPAPAEPAPSAAEIESWPSQDAPGASPAPSADETTTWPTEPPAAGSASPETWPTSAPERAAVEPPPSEVEAYPAAPSADADVPAAAAASTTAAHTVPAAEAATGESTQCPRCGTENRPGLAFCRNCGQRLVAAGVSTTVERPGTPEGTQACPRCGTHNRAGVAFCQNCGANLRGTAPGYVPPAVAGEAAAPAAESERRGAVLGPVVLLIGVVGLVTGYLLPFLYGTGSLFERAWGADGYGVAFWNAYPEVNAALADQAYFGLAAPVPLFALLLVLLAVGGFVRARPGPLQTIGLAVALLWSVGLIVLFVAVELLGNWDGDLVGMLRVLTPAGIIFFLSSLIVLIGALTRFGRS